MYTVRLFIPALVCGLMGLGIRAHKPGWRGWDEERIIFD